MTEKNRFLLPFLGAFLFMFHAPLKAQETLAPKTAPEEGVRRIEYVRQWPTAKGKNHNSIFREKINQIIFGKVQKDLNKPVSMIVTTEGVFWILDQNNKAVFQVTKKKGQIPHFIDRKKYVFSSLVGICNFRPNEVLFTDSYLNKIFLIKADKKEFRVLNDSLVLNKITGIAYCPETHEIWVIETGMHRLVVLNENGEILRTIGKRGTGRGEFNFPTHIWIDQKGLIYVVDAMNFRVQVLDKNGTILSVFGSNGDATGNFASPKGIATDTYGNIYVADALFHAVQVFDIDGHYLYTFGSQGQEEGQFWMPNGIFIDNENYIYVSDSYNSRVQVFQLVTEIKK